MQEVIDKELYSYLTNILNLLSKEKSSSTNTIDSLIASTKINITDMKECPSCHQQNIENLLLVHFIKSSQAFDDSDNESNDSEEQCEIEEELVFLGLCSSLDSQYLESRIYNVAKSQAWWHEIVPKCDDVRFKMNYSEN